MIVDLYILCVTSVVKLSVASYADSWIKCRGFLHSSIPVLVASIHRKVSGQINASDVN